MRTLLPAFLALSMLLTLPSCAGALAALPSVVEAVTDAGIVLDRAEDFVDRYFSAAPSPEAEKTVRAGLDKARAALNTALHTARGADAAGRGDAYTALADFRTAYAAFLNLTRPLGLGQVGDPPRPLGAAGGYPAGTLDLPPPLALQAS